jgi:hypothetical protein
MIYQLHAYYGAMIGDKAIYTVVMSFNDCTKLLEKPIDSDPFKQEIMELITKDGFNPNDFHFDWLTKEQYENSIESKVSKSFCISI